MAPADTFVSADWLAANLERVVPVEASFYLPGEGRDADALFETGHIPGAARFDVDAIADPASSLPHMLPDAATFARQAEALGLSDGDAFIVYDATDLLGGARAWWMLRHYGAADVRILAGGWRAWTAAGLPVETGLTRRPPGRFAVRREAGTIAEVDDVRIAMTNGTSQIVDARAGARFAGTVPEPRPGLRAGHIPGSRNVAWRSLVDDEGRLRPLEKVAGTFAAAGIDPGRPVIATCGSGVSAAVLLLALHELAGADASASGAHRLYDGSWSEWGASPHLPVAVGPS